MALFHSFLWLGSIPLCICTLHLFYPSVNEHLGCFHVLAIVNSAAMNIGVHVSFQIIVFPRYMPRSGIAGWYGNSIFSFLRNLHTIFHSGCNVIPTNSVEEFPFLHTLSSICFCGLFNDGHSDQCEVVLTAVLICISPIIRDVEHLPICLLFICMSSLEKCLFRSSAHFSIELFVFLLLSCMSCLYIWEIKPLLVAPFASIFSQSIGCLFILFMVSLAVQKLVSLIRYHLFIFAFIYVALGDWPMKTLVWFMSENVLPMFSSRSFMVACLIFKYLSHLGLFLCMVWGCVLTSLICMRLSNSPNTTCWRDCLFSIVYSCLLC